MSVTKICEICGEEFKVIPRREKTAKYCSSKCAHEALKGKPNVKCTQCGKEFHMKESRLKKYPRNMGIFCCRECEIEYRKIWFRGENNHQFGLKGELNASFKRGILTHKNGHLIDERIFVGNRPDADKNQRMTKHRYEVVNNYEKFDPILFTKSGDYMILKPGLQVHHKDWDHNNNNIDNLMVLDRQMHTQVHNQIKELSVECVSKIIGVFKGGELLGNPEVDNQQLSLNSDILESSETNNRIFIKDSNVNTSALLNQITKLVNDYIVQAEKITEDGYKNTIKKISESEIKSSE